MAAGSDLRACLPPVGDEHTLYIVDISGYLFRAYHALPPLSNSKGEPTHAVLGVTSMLFKLVHERRPALFAVAMDSKTKSFRHALYSAYKATRPPAPPDLKQQMVRVQQVVEVYGMAVFQQDGMEADDIIASLVRCARKQHWAVVIVSADKDLLQLVGDGVFMLDTMRDAVFGPEEAEKKFGVRPDQLRDWLALVGDTSDNVPGVPSVGPKTAAGLLLQYGDLDGVFKNVEQITKKALREKLIAHQESAYLSRKLVSLRDDLDIGFDAKKLVFESKVSPELIALFRELEFTRLLAKTGVRGTPQGADGLEGQKKGVAEKSRLVRTKAELRQIKITLESASQVGLYLSTRDRRALEADLSAFGLAWPISGAVEKGGNHADHGTDYVAICVTIGGPNGVDGFELDRQSALVELKPLLENASLPKICADAKRDTKVLLAHGIDLQGVAFDTSIASYLLDPDRRDHSIETLARSELGLEMGVAAEQLTLDSGGPHRAPGEEADHAAGFAGPLAALAIATARRLGPRLTETGCERLMREVELPLAPVLAEMETVGVRLDTARLEAISQEVGEQLMRLERRCQHLAGHAFNVASPRQLEVILFDELKLPVIKRTKSSRSTDRDALEDLAMYHELPSAVLEYRSLAKLKNTYLDALPLQVHPRTGRIHTEFNQTVTATGRLSSSDPNLQNIPIRSELGRQIRRAFIAREGWFILAVDYSQIELRVLAHLSRDPGLTEAFVMGQDVHSRTACAIFGVDEASLTREMRGQAKTVNYAVIYGQTEFALARNLRIDRSRAAAYIKAFFERYAGVAAYLDKVVDEAKRSGYVRSMLGRRRALPDLNSDNRVARQQAERMARNSPIQGTAADILKISMVQIARELRQRGMQSKMLLTVHDELVFEAPPQEKQLLSALVRDKMENALKLDVPLVVDLGWGGSWGEAH
jgi:DNA polymerase-1